MWSQFLMFTSNQKNIICELNFHECLHLWWCWSKNPVNFAHILFPTISVKRFHISFCFIHFVNISSFRLPICLCIFFSFSYEPKGHEYLVYNYLNVTSIKQFTHLIIWFQSFQPSQPFHPSHPFSTIFKRYHISPCYIIFSLFFPPLLPYVFVSSFPPFINLNAIFITNFD